MSPLPPPEFMRDKSREEIEAELVQMLRDKRAQQSEADKPRSIVDVLMGVAVPPITDGTAGGSWVVGLLGGSSDGGDGGGDGGGGGGD